MRKVLIFAALPVLSGLFLCFCCTQKPEGNSAATAGSAASITLPYDLEHPSQTIYLASEDLREISGICATKTPGQYLAIADERGEVFFVDGNADGAISRRVLFREKGDFEDIQMVNKQIWAIKSDGKLFEISDWENTPPKVEEFDTPLQKKDDVEGLGFDPARDVLLLACKGDPDSGYLRNIFAFDVKTRQMNPKPVYSIDPNEVNRFVPYNESEKHDYFSPSGVAIHPKTGDLYVISAALKRLLVLDKNNGKILYAARLDKKILPQPEGIAFDADGNLHLSSEGKKGEGILIRYDYKK